MELPLPGIGTESPEELFMKNWRNQWEQEFVAIDLFCPPFKLNR